MKVHQTSFNIRYSFFIGKLFPSELGLSPNSVFEGYDVSQFLILYFYSASRLLGAGLSDCHTLNQLKKKGFEHSDQWLFARNTVCGQCDSGPRSDAAMCVILGNGGLKTAPHF